MRPVEFAPDAIIQAGKELQATGRNITGFALRQKVGGGNPTRLKQVWDEHLNSQATTKAEPVADLPVEVAEEVAAVTKALTERLALLAVELNDKAVKAAERRVHEVVRTAGEQREQAERELADASQTVDDLETKLDEAATEAEALEKRLAESLAVNQAQAVELAQVRERLALIEQTATAATERMTKAETDRDTARKETNAAREEAANLRGQVEALQTQATDLVRALSDRQAKTDAGKTPSAKKS